MVAEGDGLRPLEMGVSRHDGARVLLRLPAQHPDQIEELPPQAEAPRP